MTAVAASTNVSTSSTGNPRLVRMRDFFIPNGPGSSPAAASPPAPRQSPRWPSAAGRAPVKLIMRVGPAPNAVKPGFQDVLTHWNQGFMPFWQVRAAADAGPSATPVTFDTEPKFDDSF